MRTPLSTSTVRPELVGAEGVAKQQRLSSLKTAGAKEGQGFDKLSPNGVEKVARQFEAIFLRQMIASMRSPSLGDALLGSDASNQFRDMSDARLADSMAGKFGIAQLLEKQLGK